MLRISWGCTTPLWYTSWCPFSHGVGMVCMIHRKQQRWCFVTSSLRHTESCGFPWASCSAPSQNSAARLIKNPYPVAIGRRLQQPQQSSPPTAIIYCQPYTSVISAIESSQLPATATFDSFTTLVLLNSVNPQNQTSHTLNLKPVGSLSGLLQSAEGKCLVWNVRFIRLVRIIMKRMGLEIVVYDP